jgi:hypothetical protein
MFEAITILAFSLVIGMQWYTAITYKDRFSRIAKAIKKLHEEKEDKGHVHEKEKPKYIGGDMDIVYNGSKASVKAHIYPRKIK